LGATKRQEVLYNPAVKKNTVRVYVPLLEFNHIQKIVTYSQQAQPVFDKMRQGGERRNGQTSVGDLSGYLKTKSTATAQTYDALAGKNQDIGRNSRVEPATAT